jgi:type II secretory pathway pseudopilin PulG
MKKLAIGCAVLLLLGIAGAAAVPHLISSSVTSAAEGLITELSSLLELERSVRKQGPYTPPPSGQLSRAQVEGCWRSSRPSGPGWALAPWSSSAATSGCSRGTTTT